MEKNITLRLRFYTVANKPMDVVLHEFEKLKSEIEPDYKIKISDHHIWLSLGVLKREKYSPHLHLQLERMEDGNTAVNGLYGPDPVLWTLFIFLHFLVAVFFFIAGVSAYSKASLGQPFKIEIIIMTTLVMAWFLLYYMARKNRKKGIPEMYQLQSLMERIVH
ncbi:MAG: hypothetical protein CMP76_10645 [Flavobacterium sp.]|uniref:hypothetical protein n=1 Tax=unclassified Flavobacterium TaxID=196869 RepID=UPI000C60011B|nr:MULTISPECIES: hypothetical protein [unclassified Flavobacterium]MBF03744.1 hypothetical protein [Flavobacterium sp.]MCO6162406.1 hypothetical protein [Flavobacterium sp. NRK F7]